MVATFCMVHGAWHDPSCWSPLSAELRTRGHEAIAPDLPFHDPDAGFADRVRPAREALQNVAGPVVVVGHSLGSGYTPLIAAELPGSLLVHLCPRLGPFASPPGAPDMFRRGIPFPAERSGGTIIWDPEAAITFMYARLPRAVAVDVARRLRPLAPLSETYPLAGHPDVPTVLIYAAEDEFFEPEWERFMATELLGVDPIEIPGGHFPMLEDPKSLADLLDRFAREHARSPDPP